MYEKSVPDLVRYIVGEISTRSNLRGRHLRLPNLLAIRCYAIVCLIVAAWLVAPVIAQDSAGGGTHQVTSLPHDWTHHHLVFSNPGTEEEAIRNVRHGDWLKIVNDPRYMFQQLQRHAPADEVARITAAQTEAVGRTEGIGEDAIRILPPSLQLPPGFKVPKSMLTKDWSVAVQSAASGPCGGTGNASCPSVEPNAYPAKYTFNPIAAPNCASDYVVYQTGLAGSATAANIIAYNNLYATTCSTGTVPEVYWAYNTGAAAVTTSPVLSGDGTQVAFIQVTGGGVASLVLLKWHANTTGRGITGSLSATSPNVTLTAGTLTQADVGARITGTGIPAGDTISAVLSGTTANLATAPAAEPAEALTIDAEAVGTPGVPPTAASAAAYQTCTAPCIFILTLSGSPNDTYSSPFYDYTNDALYVGDNSSKLHKFTGVFLGTPTEATPVTLNATAYDVASPVYDSVSGCVFAGDSEGYFYSVSSGVAGSVCTGGSFALFGHSELLGDGAANEGIFDAALVDSSAQMVYAFVTDSAAIGSCAAGDNCIVQFKTSTITSGSTTAVPNAEEALGMGAATDNMYAGTFDNIYYSSSTPASPSGNIYVIGNIEPNGGGTLYRVPIISNAIGAPVSVVSGLDNHHPGWESPITEFCNNGASACAVTTGGSCGAGVTCTSSGTDSIYFSTYEGGGSVLAGSANCTGSTGNGCVLAYNVSNPSSITNSGSLNITASNAPGCWTTGAFIIDNASTSTGASQIYFLNYNGLEPPNPITGNCISPGTGGTLEATQLAQGTL